MERRRVYESAASDTDAAKQLGIHRTSFRVWRVSQGLPSKVAHRRPLTPEEHARRLEVWAASVDNGDAARCLGISSPAFEIWAKKRGLRSNRHYQELFSSGKHERYLHAYYESRSDAEAARLLKVPTLAVSRWRRRNGLPSTWDTYRKRMRERKKLENARKRLI